LFQDVAPFVLVRYLSKNLSVFVPLVIYRIDFDSVLQLLESSEETISLQQQRRKFGSRLILIQMIMHKQQLHHLLRSVLGLWKPVIMQDEIGQIRVLGWIRIGAEPRYLGSSVLDDILKLSEKESDDASIKAVGFTSWVFVL